MNFGNTIRTLVAAGALAAALSASASAAPYTAYLVKDIDPGSSSGNPQSFIDVNGTLFFEANDGTNGTELWKSDGTPAGTVLLKDIRLGSSSSSINELVAYGNTLLFEANDGTVGTELWRSDGTTGGTTLVKDINPGTGTSAITDLELGSYNGAVYFEADDGSGIGDELWRTDGTAAGTFLVKDINPGSGNGDPDEYAVANGILFFEGDDGASGDELFRTDGTAAGTMLVKDINPGSSNGNLSDLTAAGSTLFFRVDDGTSGLELWKSDGTAAGTVLVKDINPGSGSGDFATPIALNGTVFGQANDGVNGVELWKSDGTAAGTIMVKDINPGVGNGLLTGNTSLIPFGNRLMFQASDGVNGKEVWTTDGTQPGTQMLIDLSPASADSNFPINWGLSVGDQFFFAAAIPDGGLFDHILYVSDGTAAGTVPIFTLEDVDLNSGVAIIDMTYSGGRIYFQAPIDISETGAASNFELFAITIVPEPSSLSLGALAVVGMLQMVRRRKKLA